MIVNGEERYYSNQALRNIFVGIIGIFMGGVFLGAIQHNFIFYYSIIIAGISITVLFSGFDKGAKDIYEKEVEKK